MIHSIYKNENTGKSRGRYENKEWYPRISDRKWRISTHEPKKASPSMQQKYGTKHQR
jgi:hypothetical protein